MDGFHCQLVSDIFRQRYEMFRYTRHWNGSHCSKSRVISIFSPMEPAATLTCLARLCGWGVGAVASHTPWTTHPIGSGILPGECQTIARAELKAVLEALTAAWEHQCPFSISCDSQIVVDKLHYMQKHPNHEWHVRIKNHDILNAISSMMRITADLLCYVSKVCSHQHDSAAQTDPEEWCFRCNDHADSLA